MRTDRHGEANSLFSFAILPTRLKTRTWTTRYAVCLFKRQCHVTSWECPVCVWRHWAATDGITSGNGGTRTAVCVYVNWREMGQLDRRTGTAGVQLLWAICDHKTNG